MKYRSFYNGVTQSDAKIEGYRPAGKLSVEAALVVYQQGYVARLTESLGDTFESVWGVLGDEIFFQVCREFIASHASQNYNLSNYSVKFIDFLISHPVTAEFPFLPDLAHLGWIHKEIFHKPQQQGLEGEELLKLLNEDHSRVFTVEAFALLKSEYCLFDIWKSLKDASEPPSSWKTPQFLVFYKSDHQVYVKQVTKNQFSTLEKIQTGGLLAEALEGMEEFEISDLFHFLAKNRICDVF